MKTLVMPAILLCLVLQAAAWPCEEISSGETQAISDTAETALKARDLWKGKIYLTHSEVVLDQAASPPVRYALLTYYRYDGDLAILVTVQLDKLAVTAVEAHSSGADGTRLSLCAAYCAPGNRAGREEQKWRGCGSGRAGCGESGEEERGPGENESQGKSAGEEKSGREKVDSEEVTARI